MAVAAFFCEIGNRGSAGETPRNWMVGTREAIFNPEVLRGFPRHDVRQLETGPSFLHLRHR